MDLFRSYIEKMFENLPRNAKTNEAKNCLGTLMAHQYEHLINQGKMPNEAISEVYLSYGDLNKIAPELGILEILQKQDEPLTKDEAENILSHVKYFGIVASICASIVFWAAIQLLFDGFNFDLGISIIYIAPVLLASVLFFRSLKETISFKSQFARRHFEDGELTNYEQELFYLRNRRKPKVIISFSIIILGILLHLFAYFYKPDYFVRFIAFFLILLTFIIGTWLVVPDTIKIIALDKILERKTTLSFSQLLCFSGAFWTIVGVVFAGFFIAASYYKDMYYAIWFYWQSAMVLFMAILLVWHLINRKKTEAEVT